MQLPPVLKPLEVTSFVPQVDTLPPPAPRRTRSATGAPQNGAKDNVGQSKPPPSLIELMLQHHNKFKIGLEYTGPSGRVGSPKALCQGRRAVGVNPPRHWQGFSTLYAKKIIPPASKQGANAPKKRPYFIPTSEVPAQTLVSRERDIKK